jgi:hypothetical protein
MFRVIRVIPTFGTYPGVTTGELGINRPMPNILASWMTRMIWTGRTSPWRSRVS